MGAYRVQVVRYGEHGAALAVPATHDADQVCHGLDVDRREGFVKQYELCVLQEQAGEKHALHLTARQ